MKSYLLLVPYPKINIELFLIYIRIHKQLHDRNYTQPTHLKIEIRNGTNILKLLVHIFLCFGINHVFYLPYPQWGYSSCHLGSCKHSQDNEMKDKKVCTFFFNAKSSFVWPSHVEKGHVLHLSTQTSLSFSLWTHVSLCIYVSKSIVVSWNSSEGKDQVFRVRWPKTHVSGHMSEDICLRDTCLRTYD